MPHAVRYAKLPAPHNRNPDGNYPRNCACVQQKTIRARLRLYRNGDALGQKVWLGLNAVAVAHLGNPRRVAGGTQVGSHFFKDAFPIARYGNGVYRRTGRGRFPLELVKLDIAQTGDSVMRRPR